MSFDCYIFTGGTVYADTVAELGITVNHDALIIAADSGYLTAKRLGVRVDMLIGDLDSLDKSKLSANELDEMEKILVSPIKDDTDTQLAIDTALSRGAKRIALIGGLGGRLDHTLSSVFMLEYLAERGIGAAMTDGKNRVHIMRASGEAVSICIDRGYKYLSIVSLTDICRGVCVSGVYYPLDGVEITRKYTYAVSNEITADSAKITLSDGVMLVIESRD